MFVAKTEQPRLPDERQRQTDDDRDDRHQQRYEAANHGSKTISSTINAAGNPNPSSPFARSSTRQGREVVVEGELTGDRRVEAG